MKSDKTIALSTTENKFTLYQLVTFFIASFIALYEEHNFQ